MCYLKLFSAKILIFSITLHLKAKIFRRTLPFCNINLANGFYNLAVALINHAFSSSFERRGSNFSHTIA